MNANVFVAMSIVYCLRICLHHAFALYLPPPWCSTKHEFGFSIFDSKMGPFWESQVREILESWLITLSILACDLSVNSRTPLSAHMIVHFLYRGGHR